MNTELSDIKDIQPPIEIAEPFPWIGVLGGGVLLLLCLCAIFFWIRHRRKPKPISPLENAQGALVQLTADAPWLEDADFAASISRIVRTYLHEALDIRALEMTEPQLFREIGSKLASQGISTDALNNLAHQCEQVKFGQAKLSEEARHALLQAAQTVIENLQQFVLIRDARR